MIECMVEGCAIVANRRGMCKKHYKRWHAGRTMPNDAQPLPPRDKFWTPSRDAMLRAFYVQYPPDQPIPLADVAAMLGAPLGTVRSRAFALGLTSPERPRGLPLVAHKICPACGGSFKPESIGKGAYTKTCSPACGAVGRWDNHPHPRGMAGKTQTAESKAKTSEAARRMWANRTPEQREEHAGRLRASVATRKVDPTKTYTRGLGGRRLDLNNQYFRSRWEANYARWLNWQVAHGIIASWEYEPRSFPFPVKRGTMSYLPDFLVTFNDGHTEWHEVKGWMTQQGATALKRFAKYYPDEVLVLIDAPVYKSIATTARALISEWEGQR